MSGPESSGQRALAIVHQRDAGPGVFGEVLRERRIATDEWLIAEESEPPSPPTGYDAVLSFGGAVNTDQEAEHDWLPLEKEVLRDLLEAEMPVLGVCLGAQLVAEAAGAIPRRAAHPEIGWSEIELTHEGREDSVLGALAGNPRGFQWHSYEFPLPPGAVALARSPTCLQAFRLGESAWGIQFHAEVSASDAATWIREYDVDPDAIRIGIDPEALGSETRERIDAWNEIGRELCGRFLDQAETADGASAR